MIVLATLYVSSTWTLSRWWASRKAWKPLYLDIAIGVIFGVSWFVNTILSINGIGELGKVTQANAVPLMVFLTAGVLLYVGMIVGFIHLREYLGRNVIE